MSSCCVLIFPKSYEGAWHNFSQGFPLWSICAKWCMCIILTGHTLQSESPPASCTLQSPKTMSQWISAVKLIDLDHTFSTTFWMCGRYQVSVVFLLFRQFFFTIFKICFKYTIYIYAILDIWLPLLSPKM